MKANIKEECERLGYKLIRNVRDNTGKHHPFGTFPNIGSGGRNYYQSVDEVEKWIKDVIQIRSF